jgi:hypothetical protein
MKLMRSVLVALAAIVAAGLAQARDNVYWSVGVDAAPGVTLGIGNHRPVVVAPQPVYVAPQPVYVVPQPVYVAPQPVYRAAPVYYGAAPVYYGPPGHRKHKHKHKKWKHHHHH